MPHPSNKEKENAWLVNYVTVQIQSGLLAQTTTNKI